MLKRVFDLQNEIQSFFASNSKSIPELEDKHWVADFAFLVNISSVMNDISTLLQGKDQLINNMYDLISVFQMKVGLWKGLRTKNFTHLPTLSMNQTSHRRRWINRLLEPRI